jgi:hypothetical protein
VDPDFENLLPAVLGLRKNQLTAAGVRFPERFEADRLRAAAIRIDDVYGNVTRPATEHAVGRSFSPTPTMKAFGRSRRPECAASAQR